MEDEGNETTLLKWTPDPDEGGDQTPASGGRWYISEGNVLVLAELICWAHDHMSMYDLYRMWLALPIFAFKRKHSESQTEQATYVRHAKMLKKMETGRWGPNEPRRGGRQRRS